MVDQVWSRSSRFLLLNWNSSLALYSLCLHLENNYFSSVFFTISVQVLVPLRLFVDEVEKLNTLFAPLAGSSSVQFPALWLVSRAFLWFSWESATWSQNENKIATLSDKLYTRKVCKPLGVASWFKIFIVFPTTSRVVCHTSKLLESVAVTSFVRLTADCLDRPNLF